MRLARTFYALGVLAGSLAGFFSPLWFLGFLPLGAGLVWAAYDIVEVTGGDTSATPQR
jgi:hypothetical protein